MWMDFNKPFYDFVRFNKSEPGLLIEVLLNNKRKQFLIGDISMFGSVMNGDCLINPETLIIRYKRIWAR